MFEKGLVYVEVDLEINVSEMKYGGEYIVWEDFGLKGLMVW